MGERLVEYENLEIASKKDVEININFLAFKDEDLDFIDTIFEKMKEIEKEYKVNCTPVNINITR